MPWDDDDWIGEPPEGRYSRDRAKPDFWRQPWPWAGAGIALLLVIVRSEHHGARRQGVDLQTRVVSIFDYSDGLQLDRWFYPDDGVAWDMIFTD